MTKKRYSEFNIKKRDLNCVHLSGEILYISKRKNPLIKVDKRREFKFFMKYINLKWQNPNDLPYRKYTKRVK